MEAKSDFATSSSSVGDTITASSDANHGVIPLTESWQQTEASASSRHGVETAVKEEDGKPNFAFDGAPNVLPTTENEDEVPLLPDAPRPTSPTAAANDKPISWASLPRKGQLAILTFARFSEPLAQTSLMAYMFYQLRWFDQSLPDSTISWQAGILQASFSATQLFTAALWGKAADHIGRKPVVLMGLGSLCLSCFVYAFSTNFVMAVVIRGVSGAMNGNVGLMRTMISEIVPEKRYQSRAFLLLPTFLSIGGILGPILGGFLADPAHKQPKDYQPDPLNRGDSDMTWIEKWPFALPSLFNGVILFAAIVLVFLGLDETHERFKHQDKGRQFAKYLLRIKSSLGSSSKYLPISGEIEAFTSEASDKPQTKDEEIPDFPEEQSEVSPKLRFRQVWTRNVVLALLSHFFLIFNIATFNSLLFTFLPTPRSSPSAGTMTTKDSGLTGGLGLSESNVGLATSFMGLLGFPLQLLVYPLLQSRLGTLKCYKSFLPFSAVAAFLAPLLILLPNHPWAVWPSLVAVLALEVSANTLSLPGSIILINESIPNPQVKGLIHGVGQSVASAAKTIGPVLGGWGLSIGLQHNAVNAIWWALGAVALVGWTCTLAMRENDENDERRAKCNV